VHIVWFVASGECHGVVSGDRVSLRGGDFFVFSPYACHDFGLYPDRERPRIYHFHLALKDQSNTPIRMIQDFRKIGGCWDIVSDVVSFLDELRTSSAWSAERFQAILILIFTSAFMNEKMAHKNSTVLNRSQRMKLLGYIDTVVTKRPSITDLALQVGLSPDYFTRVFRRTFGEPPRKWLVRERINRAATALLENDLPIAQIGAMFGYSDQFLFTRQFKQIMGTSPARYRNRTDYDVRTI